MPSLYICRQLQGALQSLYRRFQNTFSSTIPSSRVLHFILPSAIINHDWRHITFCLSILYHWYFVPISCPLLHISVSYFLCWRFMECISIGVYVYFWLGGKIIKWVASSCRAFNALDTWWFPIGYAPDEASLRLPRLFIPYIMGALPLISTISFLLIFERETIALSFVDLLSNLRQLLHCRPWVRSFKKDDLSVSSIPSLSRFYSYLYISLARTSE